MSVDIVMDHDLLVLELTIASISFCRFPFGLQLPLVGTKLLQTFTITMPLTV